MRANSTTGPGRFRRVTRKSWFRALLAFCFVAAPAVWGQPAFTEYEHTEESSPASPKYHTACPASTTRLILRRAFSRSRQAAAQITHLAAQVTQSAAPDRRPRLTCANFNGLGAPLRC